MRIAKREKGFTIIETLVVVLILGVIAGIALPSYTRMLANTKLQGKTTEWREAFYYAQREAIRLKHNVVLCPSTDGETCSNGANYSEGWIVLDKTLASGTSPGKLMRDYPPTSNSEKFDIQLCKSAGSCSSSLSDADNSITFLNNGRPKDNPIGRRFTVIYKYGKGSSNRVVTQFRVSPSGRIIAGSLTETSEDGYGEMK